MIEGKIKKYFKENCLVDQEFVKDGDLSVAQYTAKVAKDLGGEIKIVKFTRFVKGDGSMESVLMTSLLKLQAW